MIPRTLSRHWRRNVAYRQSLAPVWNRVFIDDLLAALGTRPAAALAATMTVGLYTSPSFAPNPLNTLAEIDATEAAFTGYARGTIVFTGPVNATTQIRALIGNTTFTISGSPPITGATIFGYFIVTGSDWVASERFPDGQEVNLGSLGDFLSIDLILPLDPYQSAA